MLHQDRLAAIVRRLEPNATLVRAWPLKGGVSAQTIGLEITTAAGTTRRLVFRRPPEWRIEENPLAHAQEATLLRTVAAAGMPVPTPLFVADVHDDLPSRPYLLLDYVEGTSIVRADRGELVATTIAALLARLHTARIDLHRLPFLEDATRMPIRWRDDLDESLQESRIRAALEPRWPPPPVAPRLLHGDCWPGNLLWQGETLAALLDWEDAMQGDPLADLAVSRMETLWLFGPDAMQTLTRHYAALTGNDLAGLPLWDLAAATRPCGQLPGWAATWPDLGRPDLNLATMTAAHAWFVDQAIAALDATVPSP